MSKIVSFGDSFIFGSEIENNEDGGFAWPGVIATELEVEFECRATPGSSNDAIAREIFSYYQNNSNNHVAAINWTWIMRWEYFFKEDYSWETFGIGKFSTNHTRNKKQYKILPEFYHQFIVDNQMFNKWNNLKTVFSVTNFLKEQRIPFVQTFMDHELIEEDWFNDSYVKYMVQKCKSDLQLFDGLNFLDWSKKNKFKITDPGLHPLEDAHKAAAKYWMPIYRKLLK